MRGRGLTDSSAFNPTELAVIYKAFDEAWVTIAARYPPDPATIDQARVGLAKEILTAARFQCRDPVVMMSMAIQSLERARNGRN